MWRTSLAFVDNLITLACSSSPKIPSLTFPNFFLHIKVCSLMEQRLVSAQNFQQERLARKYQYIFTRNHLFLLDIWMH